MNALNRLSLSLVAAMLFAGLTACTVSESYTVRSYRLDEGQRVKRIVQATAPSPALASPAPAAALAMFQGVAREFISHHHEYILLGGEVLEADGFDDVKADGFEDEKGTGFEDNKARAGAHGALPGATASYGARARPGRAGDRLCTADYDGKKPHGVLISQFQRLEVDAARNTVALRVEARLVDCETGLLVWRAVGENTYASNDADLEQTIRGYANRYGEETRPYVAGFFLLTRKLFDSMPNPNLSEDDIIEKIEIDALVE
ncbi:MAG: MXAN_6521/LA_1396 family lipoprotein [Leptospirales bacterium]|jgi:hypothetical protein